MLERCEAQAWIESFLECRDRCSSAGHGARIEQGCEAMDAPDELSSYVYESNGGAQISRPGLTAATGMLLLLASVSLNVVLARKVQSFRHFQAAKRSEGLLTVGATVPAIVAKRLDGHQEAISYQDTKEPTVLYIFTPPCSWCARNMDNLKTLLAKKARRTQPATEKLGF